MDKIFLYAFMVYLFTFQLIPFQINKSYPISDGLLFLVFLIYIVKEIKSRDGFRGLISKIKEFLFDPLAISMVVFLLIMLVSTSYAVSKGISIKESFRFLTYIILIFIIKYEVTLKKYFNLYKKLIYIPVFFVAIIGIFQYLTVALPTPSGLKLYNVLQRLSLLAHVKTGEVLRMESTIGDPNAYGAYLVLLLFPLIMLTINEIKTKVKIVNSILILLMLINLALTWSRNSWIALVLGLIVLAAVYNWRFIFIIIGAGFAALLVPSIRIRILQFGDSSINIGRIKIWKTAMKMIKDHPIFGVGNGNFSFLYDDYVDMYPDLRMPGYFGYPTHNAYLKVLTELGIPGIISFFIMLIFIVKRIIWVYKNSNGAIKTFVIGIMASYVTFFTLNLFDNMLFAPKVTTYFWIFVALILSYNYNDREIA